MKKSALFGYAAHYATILCIILPFHFHFAPKTTTSSLSIKKQKYLATFRALSTYNRGVKT